MTSGFTGPPLSTVALAAANDTHLYVNASLLRLLRINTGGTPGVAWELFLALGLLRHVARIVGGQRQLAAPWHLEEGVDVAKIRELHRYPGLAACHISSIPRCRIA